MSDQAKASAPGSVTGTKTRLIFLVLALVGLGASIKLTHVHFVAHRQPEATSFCAINKAVNCLNVAESTFAVLLGVPVSVWCILTYLALIAIAIIPLVRRKPPALAGLAFVVALVTLLVTVAMALISHLVIKSFCMICGVLYLANPNLLLCAWFLCRFNGGVKRSLSEDFGVIFGSLRGMGIGAGVPALLAVLLMAAYPNYWALDEPVGPGKISHGKTKEGRPWIGATDPDLTIYEFSDYQCGFCRKANVHLRKLLQKKDLKNRVRLVHYNYPLDTSCNPNLNKPFHKRACEYARAAHCAAVQGKAWEMHDLLFLRQRRRGGPNLRALASKLKLDVGRFDACLKSEEARKFIAQDIETGDDWAAQALRGGKIPGTPIFFYRSRGGQIEEGTASERYIRYVLERDKGSGQSSP